MVSDNHKLRVLIWAEWKRKSKTSLAVQNINTVFTHNPTNQRTVQYWYKRFNEGDESCEDESRSGRPVEIDEEQITTLITEQPSISALELAEICDFSPSGIRNALHRAGFSNKLDKWVPHTLSDKNRADRVRICRLLLQKNTAMSFLDRVVTCDEKWVYHDNSARSRSWVKPGQSPGTVARRGLTKKKVLLCVWWDCKGIIFYNFLKSGETINADVYCELLTELEAALKEKRPALVGRRRVVFQQDNARPHTAKKTKEKLEELSWEVLPHPPYSPDLAPSDFYLFRSLQNHLRGAQFGSDEEVKNEVIAFLDSRTPEYCKKGIEKLVSRWSDVVSIKGDYLDD